MREVMQWSSRSQPTKTLEKLWLVWYQLIHKILGQDNNSEGFQMLSSSSCEHPEGLSDASDRAVIGYETDHIYDLGLRIVSQLIKWW